MSLIFLKNDWVTIFNDSDIVGNTCTVSITSSIVYLFFSIITASFIISAAIGESICTPRITWVFGCATIFIIPLVSPIIIAFGISVNLITLHIQALSFSITLFSVIPTLANCGSVNMAFGIISLFIFLLKPSNAFSTAYVPSLAAKDSNIGSPVTSPAANIFGLFVFISELVIISPLAPSLMLAFFIFNKFVFGVKHKSEKGNLDINKIKKSGIRSHTLLIIIVIMCCGFSLMIITLSSTGTFGFFGSQTASVQSTYKITSVKVGEVAPNISIFLTNGTSITLDSLRGHPVVLWFITTWCPSCQESESILADDGYLNKLYVKRSLLVTVELYNDLGNTGPSISDFASQYGGNLVQNKSWLLYGTSSLNATYSYDPKEYLEIYYVINSNGIITNTSYTGLVNNINNVLQEV